MLPEENTEGQGDPLDDDPREETVKLTGNQNVIRVRSFTSIK